MKHTAKAPAGPSPSGASLLGTLALGLLLVAGPAAAQSSPDADPVNRPLPNTQNTPQPASPGHEEQHAPTQAPDPGQRMKSPQNAYIYIGWPNNGEVVRGRFKVWFGLRNFGVAPAGVRKDNTGHHHLIVDAELPPLDEPIPNNKNYLHFGKGQTETYLELPPGKHTLQLIMGDHDHVPHDPPIVSKKITITVRPGGDAGTRVSVR